MSLSLKAHLPRIKSFLIKRKNNPFQNCWALPGGFVDENEGLEDAARRELVEETGIHALHIEQLRTYGRPHRDPRGHMISVAYLCRGNEDMLINAGDDASDVKWFSANNLPELAFDHAEIISFALSKLK